MTPKLKTSKTKLEIQKAVVRKSFLVSLITFVIVLIIVFFCWRYAVAGVRFRQRIKFEAFSKEMSTLIVSRIQSYIEVLYGAQRFFAASKEVERSEWRLFVNPENLRERFPAIRAMRFIKRVQAEDLSNFVNQVKNDTSIYPEGYPQFQIKDLSEEGGVLNVKSEVFVVTYVEPYEGNEKMLGMDVSSDQFRWKSYEQAWVTGEPAIAKIIEITSKKSAFAVCSPIYQQGAPLFSVQEKKKAHIGFVDIIFQTQYFFKSIFGKNQILIKFSTKFLTGRLKIRIRHLKNLFFKAGIHPKQSLTGSRFSVMTIVLWFRVLIGPSFFMLRKILLLRKSDKKFLSLCCWGASCWGF